MSNVAFGVVTNQLTFHPVAPWIVALMTALWFGWMGQHSGRGGTLWAVGGGFLGLITATIIVAGLSQATAIPFSDLQRVMHRLWAIAITVAVIGLFGGALTAGLQHYGARARNRDRAGDGSATPH